MRFRSNRRKTDIVRAEKRRLGILIAVGLGVGLYLTGSFVFGRFGVRSLLELTQTRRQLEHEISSLDARNQRLHEETDALRHDPFRIEQLAREQLGMAREGEIIYRFQDGKK